MIDTLNKMIKKLDVWDIGMIKLAVILATIAVVKFVPQLTTIRFRYLVVLVIILAARPCYRFWMKK